MSHDELLGALAGHPFLAGIAPELLEELTDCARMVRYTPGHYLGRDGQDAEAFYLLRSGRVAMEMASGRNHPTQVQTLGPGEAVGWSWLVPPHWWKFSARVVEPVQAIELDGPALRQKCEANPRLGFVIARQLLGVVAARLASTRGQLLEHLR